MADIKLPALPGDWECGRFFDPEELRDRDLEVARVVLEAAAKACGHLAQADAVAAIIRALEVSHAE